MRLLPPWFPSKEVGERRKRESQVSEHTHTALVAKKDDAMVVDDRTGALVFSNEYYDEAIVGRARDGDLAGFMVLLTPATGPRRILYYTRLNTPLNERQIGIDAGDDLLGDGIQADIYLYLLDIEWITNRETLDMIVDYYF